jgi:hypothetical protein
MSLGFVYVGIFSRLCSLHKFRIKIKCHRSNGHVFVDLQTKQMKKNTAYFMEIASFVYFYLTVTHVDQTPFKNLRTDSAVKNADNLCKNARSEVTLSTHYLQNRISWPNFTSKRVLYTAERVYHLFSSTVGHEIPTDLHQRVRTPERVYSPLALWLCRR